MEQHDYELQNTHRYVRKSRISALATCTNWCTIKSVMKEGKVHSLNGFAWESKAEGTYSFSQLFVFETVKIKLVYLLRCYYCCCFSSLLIFLL